jgi:hypothetical protein
VSVQSPKNRKRSGKKYKPEFDAVKAEQDEMAEQLKGLTAHGIPNLEIARLT